MIKNRLHFACHSIRFCFTFLILTLSFDRNIMLDFVDSPFPPFSFLFVGYIYDDPIAMILNQINI
ncbi:hypothetical protein HanXRQr2_Chr07g0317131 [Helianthus annuus]|uniref:Uncharacterized protein n=1 Tax=Helianthus annuus TaxID=4232 RepID=A0A251UF26_HELAN|nr:hypothetical protein HanXRQr2_Chr07g0317131 [Helianthus annuus]